MQLSKKHKTSSQFYPAVFKSSLNFKHFGKKDDFHRFWIDDITETENVVR